VKRILNSRGELVVEACDELRGREVRTRGWMTMAVEWSIEWKAVTDVVWK